ncbi:MAG: hypothetical protein K2Q03_00020 [Sphingobacteriaceae bacterium]|nr:hypothetical protein [Sphingobacteriaceae bacterium]
MKYRKLHALLFLFILSNTLFGQTKSIGLPEIRNYTRSEYKGGTQNWAIDQDKNGNLYFANNNGLFQFDGITWTKYFLPVIPDVRCLKIDPSGNIFVGGYDEFGYFKANENGELKYHSISKLIKRMPNEKIDNIWKIHLHNNEVYFQSFKKTYIFKNNALKTLNAPNRFQFSFQINGELYFQDVKLGILKYKNGKLYPQKETMSLGNTEIWGIFDMPEKKLLIATLDNGLFLYDNQKLTPWNTDANVFIKKNSCLGGAEIKDNHIVFNTILNGIIICDKNGKIIQHINQKKDFKTTLYFPHLLTKIVIFG